MANIPGAQVKMNDVEIAVDAPVTESLFNKIGANINYLIDYDASETASRIANDAYLQGQITTNTSNIATLQSITGSNYQEGGLVTDFPTSSTTYVDVMTVTITSIGRPVEIKLFPYTGGYASWKISPNGSATAGYTAPTGYIRLLRGTTPLVEIPFSSSAYNASNTVTALMNLYPDVPGSGTFTYTLQARVGNQTGGGPALAPQINLFYQRLYAVEIRN